VVGACPARPNLLRFAIAVTFETEAGAPIYAGVAQRLRPREQLRTQRCWDQTAHFSQQATRPFVRRGRR